MCMHIKENVYCCIHLITNVDYWRIEIVGISELDFQKNKNCQNRTLILLYIRISKLYDIYDGRIKVSIIFSLFSSLLGH